MHVNDALADNNYNDWAQEMKNFLFATNKIGFIDGTLEKQYEKSRDHMKWMHCDAMIKGWLTTALEKEIRTNVKYASIAKEMWADLEERFGKESVLRAYELKQSLTAMREEGASVSAYYTKLRSLWDKIQSVSPLPCYTCTNCTCDIGKRLNEAKEKERLYEFLMGLDNEYSKIKTQNLAMKSTPMLGTAYHLVSEDEQQRAISTSKRSTVDAAAFQTFTPKRKEVTANPSLPKKQTTQKYGKRGEEVEHCNFYSKDGHSREGCFKIIGYPDWWPMKAKQEKGNNLSQFG